MPDRNPSGHKTRRDALAVAWEVVGLAVVLVLAVALAFAIFEGRVTESVAIALLIVFRGVLALRR